MIGGSNRMLSMREAAVFVGSSYRTFQSRYKEWKVPYYKVGRAVVFRERDLEGWLDARKA